MRKLAINCTGDNDTNDCPRFNFSTNNKDVLWDINNSLDKDARDFIWWNRNKLNFWKSFLL